MIFTEIQQIISKLNQRFKKVKFILKPSKAVQLCQLTAQQYNFGYTHIAYPFVLKAGIKLFFSQYKKRIQNAVYILNITLPRTTCLR